MFADSAAENNHACFFGFPRTIIQITNIADNIEDEARGFEGVEIKHVSNRSVCKSGAKDRNVILYKLILAWCPETSGMDNRLYLISPIIHGFFVIDLFSQSSDKRTGRPYYATLLLFRKHSVQYGSEPIFKFAIVIVGDDKIADPIHPLLAQVGAFELELAKVSLPQTFDKIFLNPTSSGHKHFNVFMFHKMQNHFTYSRWDEIGCVTEEDVATRLCTYFGPAIVFVLVV
jgi:hypothetical protein